MSTSGCRASDQLAVSHRLYSAERTRPLTSAGEAIQCRRGRLRVQASPPTIPNHFLLAQPAGGRVGMKMGALLGSASKQ